MKKEQTILQQGRLTKNNDLTKTKETKQVIDAMVKALNNHEIDTMDKYFHRSFRWLGNAGCGVKNGLKAFQDGWQKPFQAAFSNKVATDEARITEGEWMAAFGTQEAIHSGTFMGIKPTGNKVKIKYMDFWKVQNGKIVDNWVMIDYPDVLRQLGVDPFQGKGWDNYGEGYDCRNEKKKDKEN